MNDPAIPLWRRRLVIVTGKGGAGKTTVAAALAAGAAARGLRVLVAAVDRDAGLAALLGPSSTPLAYAPASVGANVWVCHIDPFEALGEYLGLQIGTRRVIDPVLRQRAFRQLLLAAPGWRELITLGKVWHLEQMQDDPSRAQRAAGERRPAASFAQRAAGERRPAASRAQRAAGERRPAAGGRPLFDLIVVDAPATGHGLTFLDVPRVVVSAVRSGPLRHHTERIEALIEDRERTLLLPVALAEELPVRETVELVARARRELDIALDRVVVNGVHEPPYPDDLADLDRRLAALPDSPLGALPPPRVLAACGAKLRARADLNRRYVAELTEQTGLPALLLPYLRDGLRGPGDTARLGAALLAPAGEAA